MLGPPYTIMAYMTVYRLTVLSLALGGTALAMFVLAVSTDYWLTTYEVNKVRYLSVCLSVCLSDCLSVCLSVCLSD